MTGHGNRHKVAVSDFEPSHCIPQHVRRGAEDGSPLFGPSIEDVIRQARQERAAFIMAGLGRFANWMRMRLRPRSSHSVHSVELSQSRYGAFSNQ